MTDIAEECLLDISEYIALDNPTRAETFIREMVKSFTNTLSVFPLAGKVYEELETKMEIRSLAYKKYVCFYWVNNDVVEILSILNSAQNIKNVLNSIGFME
jgi:plasmid stabilization system protein ParE